jgi:hypothetical protein
VGCEIEPESAIKGGAPRSSSSDALVVLIAASRDALQTIP